VIVIGSVIVPDDFSVIYQRVGGAAANPTSLCEYVGLQMH